MVRDSALRASKFASKLDPTVQSARIAAQKDSMISQMNQQTAISVATETSVKEIVEAAGVPSYQIIPYLAFGRQLQSIASKFSSKDSTSTGGKLAQAKEAHWKAQLLSTTILVDIAAAFGYTVTP